MSLTGCIKKAGALLHPEDRAAIYARAAELKKQGLDGNTAAKQAVQEQFDKVATQIKTGDIPPSGEKPAELKVDATSPHETRLQKLSTETPDMPVKLPGSEKSVPLSEAMKQIEAEHVRELGLADMVKAALDCAIG